MMRLAFVFVMAWVLAAGEAPTTPPPQPTTEQAVPRVVLGLVVDEGLPFDGPVSVRVTRVVAGSVSERLGLLADDRVVSVNGKPSNTVAAFRTAIAGLQAGDNLTIEIVRAGKPQQLSGVIDVPPRPKDILVDSERLKSETASVRELAEKARLRGDLEEMLRLLREFETGLPAVAAEYKRLYPKGTFDIQIHINIRSDPASPEQVPLTPAPVPEQTPKPDTKKP
ncbi:MAG: PDZ domain-containing protein [Planctomycetota bacterium]